MVLSGGEISVDDVMGSVGKAMEEKLRDKTPGKKKRRDGGDGGKGSPGRRESPMPMDIPPTYGARPHGARRASSREEAALDPAGPGYVQHPYFIGPERQELGGTLAYPKAEKKRSKLVEATTGVHDAGSGAVRDRIRVGSRYYPKAAFNPLYESEVRRKRAERKALAELRQYNKALVGYRQFMETAGKPALPAQRTGMGALGAAGKVAGRALPMELGSLSGRAKAVQKYMNDAAPSAGPSTGDWAIIQKKMSTMDEFMDRINRGDGFFADFVQRQNAFEKGTKQFRTLAQRINAYGFWFVQTALENPMMTGGKIALNSLIRFGGPAGKAIGGMIAGGISLAYLTPYLIKVLGQKGHVLNQDWHRSIETESGEIMTLQQQFRRDKGLDSLIVGFDMGFRAIDETAVYNSHYRRDEIRLNKLTQEEKVRQHL